MVTRKDESFILKELRAINSRMEKLEMMLEGDGTDGNKGLVRKIDDLRHETRDVRSGIRMASWAMGIVFSSVVLAGAEHWFGH
jgi:hypothetical protein